MDTDRSFRKVVQGVKDWWRSTGEEGRQEVDCAHATRLTAIVALIVAAVQVLYVVIDHPTSGLGSAGWVVAGGLIPALAIAGWTLIDRPVPLKVEVLFPLACLGIVQTAVICALTAGEPERQLVALWLALCVAISPPVRVVVALAVAYVAGGLPLIGTHIDSREGSQLLMDAVFWAVLAVLVHLLLARVRSQRRDFGHERSALAELARRDELTGLGNRRALQEAVEEFDRTIQTEDGSPGTLAIFDIESFKQINDLEGLSAGDRCLRAVAESLRRAVPDAGGAFRWGGDEFVVLLPNPDLTAGRRATHLIAAAISNGARGADGRPLRTRWGLGELRNGAALDDALAAADLELLEQKGLDQPEPFGSRLLDAPHHLAGAG